MRRREPALERFPRDAPLAAAASPVWITAFRPPVAPTPARPCATVDIDSANDTTPPAVITVSCPDVSVELTASTPTVPAAGTATYQIVTTAGGSGPSTDVVLTDTLPPGLTWTVGGPDAGSCSIASGVLTRNLGAVPQGGTKTVTLSRDHEREHLRVDLEHGGRHGPGRRQHDQQGVRRGPPGNPSRGATVGSRNAIPGKSIPGAPRKSVKSSPERERPRRRWSPGPEADAFCHRLPNLVSASRSGHLVSRPGPGTHSSP
jgi:uncharacterized repeat protein (TIGR01451 family)